MQTKGKENKRTGNQMYSSKATSKAAGATSEDRDHALNTYRHNGMIWSDMIIARVYAQSAPITFICTC